MLRSWPYRVIRTARVQTVTATFVLKHIPRAMFGHHTYTMWRVPTTPARRGPGLTPRCRAAWRPNQTHIQVWHGRPSNFTETPDRCAAVTSLSSRLQQLTCFSDVNFRAFCRLLNAMFCTQKPTACLLRSNRTKDQRILYGHRAFINSQSLKRGLWPTVVHESCRGVRSRPATLQLLPVGLN